MNAANNQDHAGGGGTISSWDPTTRDRAWFCVRTKPKTEHIAAAHLRDMEAVEVFSPRVRFKRKRRQSTMWVTEALFPGYIFARFNWWDKFKEVTYSNGVTGIVKFGEYWPVIDDDVIEGWQREIGESELAVCEELPKPGEEVLITAGAFTGSIAEVVRVSSGKHRVAVLMEFLGRQMQVELRPEQYVRQNARDKITLKKDSENTG